MNNRRAYYYPLFVYLLALLLVWVGAFFADVVQLLADEAVHTSASLISAKGVRWALRTALPSIDAVPWGTVMMLVAGKGSVATCFHAPSHHIGVACVALFVVCCRVLCGVALSINHFSMEYTLCNNRGTFSLATCAGVGVAALGRRVVGVVDLWFHLWQLPLTDGCDGLYRQHVHVFRPCKDGTSAGIGHCTLPAVCRGATGFRHAVEYNGDGALCAAVPLCAVDGAQV